MRVAQHRVHRTAEAKIFGCTSSQQIQRPSFNVLPDKPNSMRTSRPHVAFWIYNPDMCSRVCASINRVIECWAVMFQLT